MREGLEMEQHICGSGNVLIKVELVKKHYRLVKRNEWLLPGLYELERTEEENDPAGNHTERIL